MLIDEVVQPDTKQEQDLEQALGFAVGADIGGEARVLIHNDDVTPWDFVIYVLRTVFLLGPFEAERITATAHFNNVAYVMTLPLEEAKYRVGQAHSLARAAEYPLAFSIEIESTE
jgi:ATP-dependent Clp protease adaptor protein ClpS